MGITEEAPARAKLVMLGYGEAESEALETLATARAALVDYNVDISLSWLGAKPSTSAFKETARRTAAETGAKAVFWRDGDALYIFVPELEGGTVWVRPIEVTKAEGGDHTVGLILSSAVGSLIEGRDPGSPPADATGQPDSGDTTVVETNLLANGLPTARPATVFSKIPEIQPEPVNPDRANRDNPSDVASGPADDEDTPDETASSTPDDEGADSDAPEDADGDTASAGEPPSPSPDDENPSAIGIEAKADASRDPKRLTLSAAYGLDATSNADPAVNGGRFGLGIRLYEGLFLGVDYTVSQRLTMTAPGGAATFEVTRRPIGLGLGWVFQVRGWRFGLGGLLELDVSTEKANASDDAVTVGVSQETTHLRVSLVPEGMVGVRMVGPLFATLRAGMRILTTTPRYTSEINEQSQAIYEPWRVQARVSLGVYVEFL